ILAGIGAAGTSQAEVAVNISLLTCGQYLAMSPDQSRIYSAWMSGWFNQKMGYTYINLEAYQRNVANVKAWRGTNPGELVMTGLQRATGTKQHAVRSRRPCALNEGSQWTCACPC